VNLTAEGVACKNNLLPVNLQICIIGSVCWSIGWSRVHAENTQQFKAVGYWVDCSNNGVTGDVDMAIVRLALVPSIYSVDLSL